MTIKLDKLLHTTKETLELIPLCEQTLYRYAKDLIKKGRCPTEMGRYQFKGVRSDLWDVLKLKNYLVNEQLVQRKAKYDYQKLEQQKIKNALVVNFNTNQQRKQI
tara:strand:+ start:151 stop:465 length:315 start_codon:yes stop_codon:yes gene_type:complete